MHGMSLKFQYFLRDEIIEKRYTKKGTRSNIIPGPELFWKKYKRIDTKKEEKC